MTFGPKAQAELRQLGASWQTTAVEKALFEHGEFRQLGPMIRFQHGSICTPWVSIPPKFAIWLQELDKARGR